MDIQKTTAGSLMETKIGKDRWAIGILVLALFLRVYHLDLQFLEPYNSITRQSIVASVARNFYQNGFHFFYPEINENGRGPYLYNAEMPFYSYLMAIGYWLTGGVREWVARSVSVGFSMGMLLCLYLFARRLYGSAAAKAALLFAALSPLNVALGRSVQPEATMLFASVAALYAYYRFQETGRMRYYLFSVACLFLAIATKFFNAYLFLPLAWMAWQRQGKALFRDAKNYAYAGLACLPFIWYAAMWHQGEIQSLAYYPYRYLGANAAMNTPEVFHFWPVIWNAAKIFLAHILTPLGIVLFVAGISLRFQSKEDKLAGVWFASVLFLLGIGWKTVVQHSYYQLPLVPVCGLWVGRGWERLREKPWVRRMIRNAACAGALLTLEAASLFYFYRGLYSIPERRLAVVEAGRAAEHLTPPGSLVLASFETSPIQLYYCNRRGWAFNLINREDPALIGELEKRRQEGAGYFVASGRDDLERVAVFEQHLRRHYTVMVETPRYIIFNLRTNLARSSDF